MCICEFTIVHDTQTGYTECHGETNLSVKCTSRSLSHWKLSGEIKYIVLEIDERSRVCFSLEL